MRFLPWWRDRRSSDPAGNRLARFRKVLEAAQGFPLYSASLRNARLDKVAALERVTNIEATLLQLGIVTRDQLRGRKRIAAGTPVIMASPLAEGIRPEQFPDNTGCTVLEPKSGLKRGFRALFIRIGFNEGLLSPLERDGLWQRHGVPMFEHLVGMDGQLLAWECETHHGLHLVEENAVFESVQGELLLTSLTDLAQPTLQLRTGWAARIETEPCDCGRRGRRLVDLREVDAHPRNNQRPDNLAIAAHN